LGDGEGVLLGCVGHGGLSLSVWCGGIDFSKIVLEGVKIKVIIVNCVL
jgi:hypothetical protein